MKISQKAEVIILCNYQTYHIGTGEVKPSPICPPSFAEPGTQNVNQSHNMHKFNTFLHFHIHPPNKLKHNFP